MEPRRSARSSSLAGTRKSVEWARSNGIGSALGRPNVALSFLLPRWPLCCVCRWRECVATSGRNQAERESSGRVTTHYYCMLICIAAKARPPAHTSPAGTSVVLFVHRRSHLLSAGSFALGGRQSKPRLAGAQPIKGGSSRVASTLRAPRWLRSHLHAIDNLAADGCISPRLASPP